MESSEEKLDTVNSLQKPRLVRRRSYTDRLEMDPVNSLQKPPLERRRSFSDHFGTGLDTANSLQKPRLARRRSFTDRLEMELEDMKRKLEESLKEKEVSLREKEEYQNLYLQEREENRLLKRRMSQCTSCSRGISLPTVVQCVQPGDPYIPDVETELIQASSAPTEEGVQSTDCSEKSTDDGGQCRLCSCSFDGDSPYKVKYCHECDRFEERKRCDSFHYERGRNRRLKSF